MKKFSFWDFLTILTLVATVIVAIVVMSIYSNPNSSLNPLPVPTLFPNL